MNRGKPNWEHLNEDLHVLITVEDTRNRADVKMKRAVDEVKRLLVPAVSIAPYYHSLGWAWLLSASPDNVLINILDIIMNNMTNLITTTRQLLTVLTTKHFEAKPAFINE